jgi:hypothetical protein
MKTNNKKFGNIIVKCGKIEKIGSLKSETTVTSRRSSDGEWRHDSDTEYTLSLLKVEGETFYDLIIETSVWDLMEAEKNICLVFRESDAILKRKVFYFRDLDDGDQWTDDFGSFHIWLAAILSGFLIAIFAFIGAFAVSAFMLAGASVLVWCLMNIQESKTDAVKYARSI